MKKIHYIGFYTNDENPNEFTVFPAAATKMDYIKSVLKRLGYHVNLYGLGQSSVKSFKIHKEKKYEIDNQETLVIASALSGSGSIISILKKLWVMLQAFLYLTLRVKRGDTVVYYHTYISIWPLKLSRMLNKYTLILEVEEIYKAAWKASNAEVNREIEFLSIADGYIYVNDIMPRLFASPDKPFAVCYGSYVPQPTKERVVKSQNIEMVYAGVLGSVDSDVYLAIESVKFLPDNYKLNVLGYGAKEDVDLLILQIAAINKDIGFEKIKYHGCIFGQEYLDFLAGCDIGLSTRVLEDKYSDYTFPSKVLVYLSNHLITVSSNIKCIVESKIAKSIYFYLASTPQSVANTIMDIDVSAGIGQNDVVRSLDEDFTEQMSDLLNKLKV